MFDPVMTLESGQFHHWERRGDLICAVSGDDALFLKDGALVRGDDERAAIFSTRATTTTGWPTW